MRSVATLFRPENKPPVPYSGSSRVAFPTWSGGGPDNRSLIDAQGGNGTLFSITDRLSTAVSSLDWHLYRPAKSGKKEDRTEITSHAALDLWFTPNEFWSHRLFMELQQQYLDLVGEAWTVVVRDARFNIPLEIWPVTPTRMTPVPDAGKYLLGYMYKAPDGTEIALRLEDVIFVRKPNPADPFRGIGAVQTILTQLQGVAFSAEWNRNFFANSAEPGGVIEFEKRLSDTRFIELRDRWAEQHKGVANAHRVALLEEGKWIDRKITHKDMAFTELATVSRETIREAFGIHGHMLGQSESVNRANADAASVDFARYLVVPRGDRWKDKLNTDFMKLFTPKPRGQYEWDYDSPVPADTELENSTQESKARTAKLYIDLGFEPTEVLEYLDVPSMTYSKPEPVVPPGPGADDPATDAGPASDDGGGSASAATRRHKRNRLSAVAATDAPSVDLSAVQAEWQRSLDTLIADWGTSVTPAQRDQLEQQVTDSVNAGDLESLSSLTVDTAVGAAILTAAMNTLAIAAGAHMAVEAARQGVQTAAGVVHSVSLAPVAVAAAGLLGRGLAQSAGAEALRLYQPRLRGDEVAAAVTRHLTSLSDAYLRTNLGGALSRAQNMGRLATLRIAPLAAYFASEVLDRNTCGPCKSIDHHEFESLDDAERAYAGGAYWECQGGLKCRGTMVASWNEAVT